jgi:hypothetical protein
MCWYNFPQVISLFKKSIQLKEFIMKSPKTIFGIIVFMVIIMLAAASCWTPASDSLKPPQAVNIAAIEGVTVPVTGGTPVAAITGNAQYSGTVTWSPSVSGTFAHKTEYTATITLTAKAGYTLEGVAANFFTVAGTISVSNAANSGIVTVVFPSTAGTETDPAIIDIAVIEGVTAPITGGTPVTTITGNAQYSGTVTWEPDHSAFAPKTEYTAIITLTPKTGYTLQGVAPNFFTVAEALSVSNHANSEIVTVVFPSTAGTPTDPAKIDIAVIAGVTAPATGGTPVTTITGNAQYSGTVTWNPNHSTFAAATHYTATITLTAKTGYTLQGVDADFFTVEDALSTRNSANSGVVMAVFPSTGGTETNPVAIDIAAIEGVTVPATGGTPVTTITGNAQYSGTVTWEPDHSAFESKTHYTATITLTAKTGYTLQGVEADFFTVEDALSTSNAANSGVVTVVFPSTAGTETDPVTIEIAAIEGVTAPSTGGTPVTKITENAEYSGTVAWEPNHSAFAPDTVYTATITLTAETGYTFQGVAGNFFTVAGAESVSNPANSGVVTAVFPSTAATVAADVINIPAIEGVTVPVTGGTPVSTISGAQYTGTVAWNPNDPVFVAGTQYTATITLTPNAGYTFHGVAADFFTVAGAESVSSSADSGVITVVFPVALTVINIAAIQGITVPAINVAPVTSITETEQYTGTVEWSPSVWAIRRTVRIVMYNSAGNGWGSGGLRIVYNGSTIGTVRASGAGSANVINNVSTGNSFQIYWVAGPNQEQNSFIIYYLDAPPTPEFNSSNNDTWNGSNALMYRLRGTMNDISDGTLLGEFTAPPIPDIFTSGNQYTATITLTPKPGYTLEGVEANFFTVAGATSANNSANSGVITVPFPRTAYALGDIGPGGGRIFYVNTAGFTVQGYGNPGDPGYFASYTAYYLEAAPNNMPTTLAWASTGYTNTSIPDAKFGVGSPIGAGRKNTAAILAIDPDAPAAKACVEYSSNGMTDWFFPSEEELNILNTNRSYVGNMGSNQYWTSTETMFSDGDAYGYYFSFMSTSYAKTQSYYVRAIRAF